MRVKYFRCINELSIFLMKTPVTIFPGAYSMYSQKGPVKSWQTFISQRIGYINNILITLT